MPVIRIGPAGWSYEDWKGKVYPEPPPKGFDALEYLSRIFPVIEINSSFYRPPTPRMAEAWARRTPDGFVFTAKLWERFTHGETFSPDDVRVFQEGIAPLLAAGKLAALLLQFPWYFKDTLDARDRIRTVAESFGEWAPLVIEVRHKSWLDALDFLKSLKLNFCNIDQPRSSTSIQGTDLVTGPVGYVRFHGRNYKAWFSKSADRDQKYDYLYPLDELREWSGKIGGMKADAVFAITNNHFLGKGIVNAIQLMRLLDQPVPEIPEPIRSNLV
jgi:uncharacterized protein YecE (DUF72 family)